MSHAGTVLLEHLVGAGPQLPVRRGLELRYQMLANKPASAGDECACHSAKLYSHLAPLSRNSHKAKARPKPKPRARSMLQKGLADSADDLDAVGGHVVQKDDVVEIARMGVDP